MDIPNWIKPADPTSEFMRAYAASAQVAHAERALQQDREMTEMQTQARMKLAEQEARREQQRIGIDAAYKQAQARLAEGRLNQAKAVAQQKADEAARALTDQQGFANAVASGMSPMEALAKFPRAQARTVSAAQSGQVKDYGAPEQVTLPTGDIAIYRKGTPAVHLSKTPRMNPARVTLGEDGAVKSMSGPISDPSIIKAMGDNAPAWVPGRQTPEPKGNSWFDPNQVSMPIPPSPKFKNLEASAVAPEKPSFPQAPSDRKARKAGQVYQTPKGPHVWTGEGWKPYTAPEVAATEE